MKLRGIDFGAVTGSSGIQGFFNEGYAYHRVYKRLFPRGFSFGGMTFVAKTTTLEPRKGNMPLRKDGITPVELKPACIVVTPRSFLKGAALNAVGLSGPGARALLADGRWQARTDSFFISFMSVGKTKSERYLELMSFVDLLQPELPKFKGKVGLQINFSCPNVGLHTESLVDEICLALQTAGRLGIPLVPKINLLMRPEAIRSVMECEACDAICVSNTLPWGSLPERIDWKGLFGSTISPLARFGGGGLSGAPLFPLLIEWLDEWRRIPSKPVIAGGGIMGLEEIQRLAYFHRICVSLGTIAMLRPWRVAKTIQAAKCI